MIILLLMQNVGWAAKPTSLKWESRASFDCSSVSANSSLYRKFPFEVPAGLVSLGILLPAISAYHVGEHARSIIELGSK